MIKVKNLLFGILWAITFQIIITMVATIVLSLFLSSKGINAGEISKMVAQKIKGCSNVLMILPIYFSVYLTRDQKLPGTKSKNWENVNEIIDKFNISISLSLVLQLLVVQGCVYVVIKALYEGLRIQSAQDNKYITLISLFLYTIVSYIFFNRTFKINILRELTFMVDEIKIIPILLFLFILEFIISSELGNIGIKYMPFKLPKMAIYQNLFNCGLLSIALLSIVGPIFEEYFFRRILLKNLLKNYSPFIAIAISSLFFAVVHLNPDSFFALFFIGSLLGTVYYFTNNLKYCVILHGIHNFVIYLLVNKIIKINVIGFSNESAIPKQIMFQPLWLDLTAISLLIIVTLVALQTRKVRSLKLG